MDFYLAIDGSKSGPFSIFKVGELLRAGTVTPDSYAWHRGLDEWKPIREIPSFDLLREEFESESSESPVEEPPRVYRPQPRKREDPPDDSGRYSDIPLPSGDATVAMMETEYPRPLIRFWARMFDYTLVSVIVFYFSGPVIPQIQLDENFNDALARHMDAMRKPESVLFLKALFFSLLSWHFLEAVLIHLFGSTPGKAVFGIRVRRANGERVPMLLSLGRSFYVYLLGVGFYQFPFILIGAGFSYFRLITTGRCLWDSHLGLRVEHSHLSPARILLAIFAFFILFALQSFAIS